MMQLLIAQEVTVDAAGGTYPLEKSGPLLE